MNKTVNELSPIHQLAIRAAAKGCCSGKLREWPVLAAAFEELGYYLPGTTSAADLIDYANVELVKILPQTQEELAELKEALDLLAREVLEQGRYLRRVVQLLGLEEGDLHG